MSLQISERVRSLAARAQSELREQFDRIDAVASNTQKVLSAFQKHHVAESYFAGTTGYGYDDLGRDKLEEIYAEIFGAEDALVRLGFVNGTHAIACALFGALKPGEVLVSAVGAPYDTLLGVIGVVDKGPGSLKDYHVEYRQVELVNDADPEGLARAVKDPGSRRCSSSAPATPPPRPPLLRWRRSAPCAPWCGSTIPARPSWWTTVTGNSWRSGSPRRRGRTWWSAPSSRTPAGALPPQGGYLAGRKDLIEAASMRLTVPGIGRECGATLGTEPRPLPGALPHPTRWPRRSRRRSLPPKSMELLGYATEPTSGMARHDIIQMIHFGAPEPLKQFCKGINPARPVDSYVTPEPWDMPGYDSRSSSAAGPSSRARPSSSPATRPCVRPTPPTSRAV